MCQYKTMKIVQSHLFSTEFNVDGGRIQKKPIPHTTLLEGTFFSFIQTDWLCLFRMYCIVPDLTIFQSELFISCCWNEKCTSNDDLIGQTGQEEEITLTQFIKNGMIIKNIYSAVNVCIPHVARRPFFVDLLAQEMGKYYSQILTLFKLTIGNYFCMLNV